MYTVAQHLERIATRWQTRHDAEQHDAKRAAYQRGLSLLEQHTAQYSDTEAYLARRTVRTTLLQRIAEIRQMQNTVAWNDVDARTALEAEYGVLMLLVSDLNEPLAARRF